MDMTKLGADLVKAKEIIEECDFLSKDKKRWYKGMLEDCSFTKLNVGIGYLIAFKDMGYNVSEILKIMQNIKRKVGLQKERAFCNAIDKLAELKYQINY